MSPLSPVEIIKEIESAVKKLTENDFNKIGSYINFTEKIYITGQGRSGLVAKMFAMRLTHLGYTAFVVGDATTPAIGENDLLIACSGSGKTRKVLMDCETAQKVKADVIAFTAEKNSDLVKISDEYLLIPTSKTNSLTVQYGGTLFEQSLLIVLDSFSGYLQSIKGTSHQEMDERHTNLE